MPWFRLGAAPPKKNFGYNNTWQCQCIPAIIAVPSNVFTICAHNCCHPRHNHLPGRAEVSLNPNEHGCKNGGTHEVQRIVRHNLKLNWPKLKPKRKCYCYAFRTADEPLVASSLLEPLVAPLLLKVVKQISLKSLKTLGAVRTNVYYYLHAASTTASESAQTSPLFKCSHLLDVPWVGDTKKLSYNLAQCLLW